MPVAEPTPVAIAVTVPVAMPVEVTAMAPSKGRSRAEASQAKRCCSNRDHEKLIHDLKPFMLTIGRGIFRRLARNKRLKTPAAARKRGS